MKLRSVFLLAVSQLILLSCDRSATTAPEPPGQPAQVLIVSGNAQTGTVGSELGLPLLVHVVDSTNRNIPNQLVNFRVLAGGGSVFAGSALTNEQGIAQERWTLGPVAGEQVVEARAVDSRTGGAIVFGRFTATALPDIVFAAVAVTGNNQIGRAATQLADTLSVRVRDRFANPVPNVTVQWSANPGHGTVVPLSATTDNSGVARALWTLGPIAGPQSVVATPSGLPGVVFQASATAAPVTSITVVPPNAVLRVGQTVQLRANVVDANGQAVARPASWSSTDANIAVVDSTGLVRALNAGATQISATIDGVNGVADITVQLIPVATVEITSAPPTVQVGTSTQLTAITRDSAGNFLHGRTVTWTSSMPVVAQVSTGGVLTAVSAGQAVITAHSEGKQASFSVMVIALTTTVARVVVTPTSTTILVGSADRLTAIAYDSAGNQLDRTVAWTTSNPTIATVDAAGLVIGRGLGNAQIYADVDSVRDTAFITVTSASSPVASVQVSPDSAEIFAGVTRAFTATLRDAGGAIVHRSIAWTTSDSAVVTIDGNGLALARSPGRAYVIATSEGKVDSAVVTVPTIHADIIAPPAEARLTIVDVRVTAASAFTMSSVTADVAGRQTTLTLSGSEWVGSISLSGLPVGPALLTVTARDVQGNVARDTVTIIHDAPPVIELSAPTDLEVANPDLRIIATCRSDDGPGCSSITAAIRFGMNVIVLASGTDRIDTTVSLASYAGNRLEFIVNATDSAGLFARVERIIYAENSSALVPVAEVPGQIFDANATHILYRTADSTQLVLYDRASGASTVLLNGASQMNDVYGPYLTPFGAVAVVGYPVTFTTPVMDLRPGSATQIGTEGTGLRVAGNYLIWNQRQTLLRYDLAVGSAVTVSTNAGNINNDVTSNGDVVFWQFDSATDYNIWRYSGGSLVQLTMNPLQDVYPMTDGTTVVFGRNPTNSTSTSEIVMLANGVETVLTPATAWGPDWNDYGIRDGWIGFRRVGGFNVEQIWMRSPSGEELPASSRPVRPRLQLIAPDGSLLYGADGRYATGYPYGTSTRVTTNAFVGRPYVIGTFHISIGRRLFAVQF